jgi:hypothetical protein
VPRAARKGWVGAIQIPKFIFYITIWVVLTAAQNISFKIFHFTASLYIEKDDNDQKNK